MIAIQNIEKKKLEISFEGYTYTLPGGKNVLIEEDLYEHIKEICPLAIKKVKTTKKLVKAKRVKTKSYLKPETGSTYQPTDMKTTQAGKQVSTYQDADNTPDAGTIDKDGVGWYGEGVTIETI